MFHENFLSGLRPKSIDKDVNIRKVYFVYYQIEREHEIEPTTKAFITRTT